MKEIEITEENREHVEKILENSSGTVGTPPVEAPISGSAAPPAQAIASESGHWYLPDGTPFYTTERRSGTKKGEPRAVSLRHDRKLLMSLCAVPSVTTVSGILDKPGLVRYRARNVFEATLNLVRGVEETLDEYFERVYTESETHRRTAADRGQELHGEVERYLLGEPLRDAPKWWPHIDEIVKALAQYGITLKGGVAEHSFAYNCGTGCYGGKVDYHEKPKATGIDGLVIDFKSKEEITDAQLAGKEKLVYDEHAMQLAAYREGLLLPLARCINIFVGEKDRRVFIYEHNQSDLKRGMRLFKAVLQAWKIKNNYYVRI